MKRSAISTKLFLYFIFFGTWKLVFSAGSDETDHTVHKEKLKFYSKDKAELTPNDFRLSEGYGLLYEFNNGVKCAEIKYNGKEVWKHSPSVHGKRYPNQLYIHDFAYLYFRPFCYGYKFDKASDHWEFDRSHSSLPPTGKLADKPVRLPVFSKFENTSTAVGPLLDLIDAAELLRDKAHDEFLNKLSRIADELTKHFTSLVTIYYPDFDKILTIYSDLTNECHKLNEMDKHKIDYEYYALYCAYRRASENGWSKVVVNK